MTYPICHTRTQFTPGVAFHLFQQPEQQAAFSAVLTPPLPGFQVSLLPEILDGPLHRRPGEGQFPGNGANGRPALTERVRPVREIDVDRFGPVGEILVIIDLLQFPQYLSLPWSVGTGNNLPDGTVLILPLRSLPLHLESLLDLLE